MLKLTVQFYDSHKLKYFILNLIRLGQSSVNLFCVCLTGELVLQPKTDVSFYTNTILQYVPTKDELAVVRGKDVEFPWTVTVLSLGSKERKEF